MPIFNWKDFLDTADHILTHQSLSQTFYQIKEEAVLRTVISRAYYAIFKQIEDYLVSNQIEYRSPDTGSHNSVINFLRHIDVRFSWKLRRLKGLRIVSDYKQRQRVVNRDAETAIRLAKYLSSLWPIVRNQI